MLEKMKSEKGNGERKILSENEKAEEIWNLKFESKEEKRKVKKLKLKND